MKLADWLERNEVKRGVFAKRIGVSPALVTQLCNDESVWISRGTAEAIIRETAGAVTANDFVSASAFDGQERGAACP